MVDLPESMKTGGFDPQKAAVDLDGERNRARATEAGFNTVRDQAERTRQQIGQRPLNIPNVAGGIPTQPNGPQEGQPWSRETDSLTQAEGVADRLNQQRSLARAGNKPRTAQERAKAIKKIRSDRKKQEKLDALSEDKDYPNPITLRVFQAFAFIAVCQDGVPLICDLVGIGWIVEYCLLPITWFFYWYLIIRQAPKSMKKKFWQRTLLITCVGWIPVVGQFIPEWTATALGAYIVIAMYQRRKSHEAAGKASDAARGGGAKKGATAAAGASSKAAQAAGV